MHRSNELTSDIDFIQDRIHVNPGQIKESKRKKRVIMLYTRGIGIFQTRSSFTVFEIDLLSTG